LRQPRWQRNSADYVVLATGFGRRSFQSAKPESDPALFAPNYQPPRSVEINFGIQRELRHGMVFSADYLRNIETRNLPNFGNFNLPPNTMNGIVFGTGNGSINDTTRADNEAFRVRNGTGVYGLGGQRQIEFGLRFVF
jgi:hypothetical protein